MTIEEIKELLHIFNESGIGELELHRGDDQLRLRKAGEIAAGAPAASVAPLAVAMPGFAIPSGTMPVAAMPAAPAAEPVSAAPAAPAPPPQPETPRLFVKSPLVGTFYESSKPGTPPYVKVGDSVEKDQVVGIIDCMKLMNEISAEVSGTIAAKLVENGTAVEGGTPLFAVIPR